MVGAVRKIFKFAPSSSSSMTHACLIRHEATNRFFLLDTEQQCGRTRRASSGRRRAFTSSGNGASSLCRVPPLHTVCEMSAGFSPSAAEDSCCCCHSHFGGRKTKQQLPLGSLSLLSRFRPPFSVRIVQHERGQQKHWESKSACPFFGPGYILYEETSQQVFTLAWWILADGCGCV